MTVAVAVVAASTGIGIQDITTTDLNGTTPKAVFFFYSRVGADGTISTVDSGQQYGVTDGITQAAVACILLTGYPVTVAKGLGKVGKLDKCLVALEYDAPNFVIHSEASFDSFIPDGVRVNWTSASADAWMITALFFAGSEWTSKVTTHAPTDLTGVTVTTGFQPDGMIVIGSCDTMVGTISQNDCETGYGCVTWFNGTLNSTSSNTWGWLAGRDCWNSTGSGNSGQNAGHVDLFLPIGNRVNSRTSTGFTAGTQTASGTPISDVYVTLSLKYTGDGQLRCGVHSITSASSGNQSYTGFGGRVREFMLLQPLQSQLHPSASVWRYGYAAVTPTKIGGYAVGGLSDNASISAANQTKHSNTHFTDKIRMLDGTGTGVENAVATLVSFDANGYTLNWTDPPQYAGFPVILASWSWMFLTIVDTTANKLRNQAWIID